MDVVYVHGILLSPWELCAGTGQSWIGILLNVVVAGCRFCIQVNFLYDFLFLLLSRLFFSAYCLPEFLIKARLLIEGCASDQCSLVVIYMVEFPAVLKALQLRRGSKLALSKKCLAVMTGSYICLSGHSADQYWQVS